MANFEIEGEMTSQMFNERFLAALDSINEGSMEKVAAAASQMTRRKLREDAISPAIIPHDDVTNADLDYFLDERIGIICEMEPDSYGAKTISFEDTADTVPYYGVKYVLEFYANTTPEWTKNVDRLRTYRGDLREIITDNSLRDLSRQKDVKFFKLVDSIVGVKRGGISDAGLEQNVVYGGRLNRDNFISSTMLLRDRQLLNGVFVVNARTWTEFARWKREEMGGDFSQDLVLKGNKAWETARMFDVDFIVTMKHDLVPNGVMYQFTKPNYLGRAGVLQKPTMYVKKDKDILRFSCREKLGVAIANVAGVQKVTFAALANATGGDGRLTPNEISNYFDNGVDPGSKF